MVTDRPDQTESPITVPQNFVQIETGFIYENAELQQYNYKGSGITLAGTLLRYGLIKNLELRFGGEYFIRKVTAGSIQRTTQGLTGISVGTKLQFLNGSYSVPDAAFIVEAELPVGDSELRPTGVEPALIFSISRPIGKNGSTGLNIGGLRNSDTKQIDYLLTYTISYGIDSGIGLFTEYYGSFIPGNIPIHYFDCGMTYLIASNLQWDLSGGTKLNGDGNYWFVSSGVSVRFPR